MYVIMYYIHFFVMICLGNTIPLVNKPHSCFDAQNGTRHEAKRKISFCHGSRLVIPRMNVFNGQNDGPFK